MTRSILQVEGLTKKFGELIAVDQLHFAVNENEILGLIGPNGSGKTVTFNLITGVYRPDAGGIRFEQTRIDGLKPHQISQLGVGRTFQLSRPLRHLTVFDNLRLASRQTNTEEKARELMELFKLLHLRNENAGNLSYGQQRLLEFARVMMTEPKLILLDEPTAGVNPTLATEILEYIEILRESGKTFLIVEHNMKVVMNVCERLVVLDSGTKIAQGTPAEIRTNERVIQAYFGR